MINYVRNLFLLSVVLVVGGCAQIGSFFPSLMNYGFSGGATTSSQIRCIRESPNNPADAASLLTNNTPSCRELQAGMAEYKASNLQAAEQKLKSAFELYTSDGGGFTLEDLRMGWFALAAVYDLQGRYQDADKTYNFIFGSFGESVRYYNNYGYSLYLRKDKVGARQQWLKGLQLAPSNQALLNNLESVADAPQTENPEKGTLTPQAEAGNAPL